MPSLEVCKRMVIELEETKGWGKDPATKIYYAILELAEAGNLWKHRLNKRFSRKAVIEELIDAVFYIVETAHHIDPEIDLDLLFLEKYQKNLSRERLYPDDREVKPDE